MRTVDAECELRVTKAYTRDDIRRKARDRG
jgi:hypothetical protein